MNCKIKFIYHKRERMRGIENFFTSGLKIEESSNDLKSRYQMVNIALVLSSISLIYGMVGNYLRDVSGLIPLELFLLSVNSFLFFALRRYEKSFEYVCLIVTAQFSFLFLFLVYTTEPTALKHIWLFTYPIILLYFQRNKNGLYWLVFMLLALIIAPLQNFVEVQYSLYQITYISFVLIIVSAIVYFYKLKMDEARELILQQQALVLDFNKKLEEQVKEKTFKLQELNDILEMNVQDKIEKLIEKDELLTTQSKQAVMGEMISMIAHQWRQPLSMITLQISNLQITRLLGNQVSDDELYKTLTKISDTIVYLSDTIDDFQTYFHPNKEVSEINIFELLQRAINFSEPRLKSHHVEIVIEDRNNKVIVQTYVNELLQVILNILNNAIDVFTERETQKAKVSMKVENQEEIIKIYIEDNAGGINEEHLPRIFEPYFSTKGKNGTGLGLYMSQMIIEKQFGGEIKVQSSSESTTFIVEIPKKRM
uniref:histidine kinase n=1 Tax=uncultured Campylobacterota bacterium TaxID=120858 RepID=Q2YZL7_9BACT|nr:hypothetical protein [uncultured Campylobacterota bacterium]